jgi:hypothetical protein
MINDDPKSMVKSLLAKLEYTRRFERIFRERNKFLIKEVVGLYDELSVLARSEQSIPSRLIAILDDMHQLIEAHKQT